ncbi:hypothetical protein OH76DRAFT_1420818 [Lentinus brumalis]|uniref:Uncharacterized protein n=1 Tax=Lentinus brumalis TaxID=2498619 RepID=A0A371CYH4_9APHY|nr:hypothetical protein OH76DRAFT_1420818 [Polyporus brumalis]
MVCSMHIIRYIAGCSDGSQALRPALSQRKLELVGNSSVILIPDEAGSLAPINQFKQSPIWETPIVRFAIPKNRQCSEPRVEPVADAGPEASAFAVRQQLPRPLQQRLLMDSRDEQQPERLGLYESTPNYTVSESAAAFSLASAHASFAALAGYTMQFSREPGI